MARMTLALAGVISILLSSCSKTYDIHEIGGVSDKFCVPKNHTVNRIPWIPANIPEGDGFAFSGCWRADLKSQKGCSLPKLVVGGVTGPAASFRSQRWQDIEGNSLIKRTIQDSSASLDAVDGGHVVIASNPKVYWGWFVWRKANSNENYRLEDGDELIATCQKVNVISPGTAGTRQATICRRSVLGKNYALTYSFESKRRAPKDIEKLDMQVFAGINRWRCKK